MPRRRPGAGSQWTGAAQCKSEVADLPDCIQARLTGNLSQVGRLLSVRYHGQLWPVTHRPGHR
jgi:hypothetical protein